MLFALNPKMDSMEFSVPMLLPKGIVMNASSVYKEVASYPVVPADKIWEYWHGKFSQNIAALSADNR